MNCNQFERSPPFCTCISTCISLSYILLAAGRKQWALFKEKQLCEACETNMYPSSSILHIAEKEPYLPIL